MTSQMPDAPLSAVVLQTIRRKSHGRSLSFSRFVFIRFIERCCIIKCPRDDSSLAEQYVPPSESDYDGMIQVWPSNMSLLLNPILTELLQTPYMSSSDYNASNRVMNCVYVVVETTY